MLPERIFTLGMYLYYLPFNLAKFTFCIGGVIIAFRKKAGRGDRRFFRDTAKKVRAINLSPAPARGGTRL